MGAETAHGAERGVQQASVASLTVTVPLPDHRLTINRVRTHPAVRHRMVEQHREQASWAALVALNDLPSEVLGEDGGPLFPVGVALIVWVAVERRKRGQRWDLGGLIEALKPAFDGCTGLVYADDRQLTGVIVEWDAKPTGAGVVHLRFALAAGLEAA